MDKVVEEIIAERKRERQPSQQAVYFSYVVMWWIAFIVLGTLTGAWVKIFWIGWVFAR